MTRLTYIITAILVHTTHITFLSLFHGISLLYFGLAGHNTHKALSYIADRCVVHCIHIGFLIPVVGVDILLCDAIVNNILAAWMS
ncbi:hypothetical protein C8R48DRAFT_225030 [Suillus tomentosus]|nr:hypothetical protein C8R48DRAFT_225030 [Suillus tomentosus]